MSEQMEWRAVYDLWKIGCYDFPKSLTAPYPLKPCRSNTSRTVNTSMDTTGWKMRRHRREST